MWNRITKNTTSNVAIELWVNTFSGYFFRDHLLCNCSCPYRLGRPTFHWWLFWIFFTQLIFTIFATQTESQGWRFIGTDSSNKFISDKFLKTYFNYLMFYIRQLDYVCVWKTQMFMAGAVNVINYHFILAWMMYYKHQKK